MYKSFTIDNIKFHWHSEDMSGVVSDEENLGFNTMVFPESMLRVFLKERGRSVTCPDTGRPRLCLPHEDEYRLPYPNSSHECWNSDTQIVFLNHFYNKRRKYEVEYCGIDNFWLFHDTRHSLNDVYWDEVGYINSHIEMERLYEGAELAKMHGECMNGLTLYNLEQAWNSRWKSYEGSNMQELDWISLRKTMSLLEATKYDLLSDFGGEPRIIEDYEAEEFLNAKKEEE